MTISKMEILIRSKSFGLVSGLANCGFPHRWNRSAVGTGADSDVDWRVSIDDHMLAPGVWQESLFRRACWIRRTRAKGLPDDAICSPYLRLSAASSLERHEMYIFDLI